MREDVKIKQVHHRIEDMGDTHVLRTMTEGGVEVSVAWRRGEIVQVVVSTFNAKEEEV